MKEWFFCMILCVILCSCVPGEFVSPQQPGSEETLTDTKWLLDYVMIDDKKLNRSGTITFYDESIYISDYCVGQWYEPAGDGAVYTVTEQGDFALAEERHVSVDDLEGIVCEEIDVESGNQEARTTPWFSAAFEQVVALELQGKELYLYYPEDRSEALVFRSARAIAQPRDIAPPNPRGQILDGTDWVLEHAIIDGEMRMLKAHETFEIGFSAKSVKIYDGCNYSSYENESGGPSYVAARNGDFALPWGATSHISTMKACYLVNEESGQSDAVDGPDFMPWFDDIVAYDFSPGELRLYYPEDKRNVLVLRPATTEPQQ